MSSKPSPSPPIPAQVGERLRELVRSRHFEIGSRLPSERTIAAQLGVSRNSVREAVIGLRSLGIVEVRRGSGTYLKTIPPAPTEPPPTAEPGGQDAVVPAFPPLADDKS